MTAEIYSVTENSEDHKLMLAVKDGDVDKLGLLFERYNKKIFNFYLYQIHDNHISEDLLQEVFLRILKYQNTYTNQSTFKTWIFKIAHNVMIDYLKKNKKMQTQELDMNIKDETNTPEKMLLMKREIQLLKAALRKINNQAKELILMSKFQNMCYKEIGKVLGCSEGTIKVRMHRAIKELSHVYHQLTGGDNNEM